MLIQALQNISHVYNVYSNNTSLWAEAVTVSSIINETQSGASSACKFYIFTRIYDATSGLSLKDRSYFFIKFYWHNRMKII